ncbi:hypothetical protein HZS_4737 [Henneguya salminicola]|nr:hypothetical protein HZS_4737 [Henneguya salminicola]
MTPYIPKILSRCRDWPDGNLQAHNPRYKATEISLKNTERQKYKTLHKNESIFMKLTARIHKIGVVLPSSI